MHPPHGHPLVHIIPRPASALIGPRKTRGCVRYGRLGYGMQPVRASQTARRTPRHCTSGESLNWLPVPGFIFGGNAVIIPLVALPPPVCCVDTAHDAIFLTGHHLLLLCSFQSTPEYRSTVHCPPMKLRVVTAPMIQALKHKCPGHRENMLRCTASLKPFRGDPAPRETSSS